jgi:rhodanese-related sulfurtransferase
MKHISINSFKEVLLAEKSNESIDFINVCTPAEYKEQHIKGVRSVPLDTIAAHVDEFKNKKTIYVHCRSGNRSKRAIETLTSLGVQAELVNVEGGITAWQASGLETHSLLGSKRMPVMQQVLLTAGVLVLTGFMLSKIGNPSWIYLSVFVGVGLTFSGATGWCGMAYVLSKMPWNK